MTLQSQHNAADKVGERILQSTERQLTRAYLQSLREIRADMAVFVERYAVDGKLSYAEVQKYSRLANLDKQITDEMRKLGRNIRSRTEAGLLSVYQADYYRMAFGIEGEVQAKLAFGLLDKKQVLKAIENPLDRIGWKERSAEQIDVANRQVREAITRGIIQGQPYEQIGERITERMEVSASKALRIARTETHRCQQQGRLDAYEHADEQGVEMEKAWLSTVDSVTRDDHQDLDGQTVGMDEDFTLPSGETASAPGMFGVPEQDINCRCSVRAQIKGFKPTVRRIQGEGVVPYKTFKEYAADRLGADDNLDWI